MSIKKNILEYLREEFEEDPDYSRISLADICSDCGVTESEEATALEQLQNEGKAYRYDDCEGERDTEWQACGGTVRWDDDDQD